MDWQEFNILTQWLIERQWTIDERRNLGLENEQSEVDEEGFIDMVASTLDDLQAYLNEALDG